MIENQRFSSALKAIQRLIVHAKSEAYDAGADTVAALLNDIELLPEYLADDDDRTAELIEALEGIATAHPNCQYILDEFSNVPVRAT